MTKIVRFVPKSDLERERLIREARAIYDSIFPPVAVTSGQAEEPASQRAPRKAAADIQPKQR